MGNDGVGRPQDDRAEQLASAVDAGRWADAVDLIEQHWSSIMAADIAVLRTALAALPPVVIAENPRLAAARSYVEFIPSGDAPRPVQFRDQAAAGHPEALLDVLARLTSRSGARRSAGQFVLAAESVDEAREVLTDATEDVLKQLQPALPELVFHWGKAREFAAQGPAAYREYRDAYDLAVVAGDELVTAKAAGALAWLSALSGYFDEARSWLGRMPAAESWQGTRNATTAHFARVLLLYGELRYAEATEILDSDVDVTLSPEYWAVELFLRSRLVGDAWQARELLSSIASAVQRNPPALSESGLNAQVLTRARVQAHLALQHPDRARQIVTGYLTSQKRFSQSMLVEQAAIELVAADDAAAGRFAAALIALDDARLAPLASALLVNAVCAMHAGDDERAVQVFERVVHSVVRDGLLTVLTVISRGDLARLASLIDFDTIPGGREVVEQALERGIFAPAPITIAPLSPRERSVLAELRRGASVADIAATLQVSHNTIKSQLRSVYRKLGVANREEAEAAAARYGLV
ncbi:helix-turn-helix transcriptional regulator [Subtercola endophyticus]|uniref:helix-turn-helix transcriptional regulator n=1 Tax=Subtercola endophyticus TaxID=2895559 RepID=UPI001E59D8C7|nr:LuxR family transcriptional regulator [Subtercola endophyticus]UFS60795.1 LuxR C-terminal-related transcriptional regulator [Subtercola endophyticus]